MSDTPARHPLITAARLEREGIPNDARFHLRTHGTRVSYGVIPPAHLFGTEPSIAGFQEIARQGQDWHPVHHVELHVIQPQNRKKSARLQLPLTPPLHPPGLNERSHAAPIAVWARTATDTLLRDGQPFAREELLTLTYVDGELRHGDTVLFGTAPHVIHRYHSVVYCGRDMRLDEFSWLPSRNPNALSIMQDMAQNVGVTDPHRTVIDAYWNAPDELADILRAFIRRFGPAHAKALLGDILIQAILDRRLREEVDPCVTQSPGQALISFAESDSEHGQLELH